MRHFFGLASVLLIAAYCVRLAIRSDIFQKLLKKSQRRVRARSAIPEGQNTPTHAWLTWLLPGWDGCAPMVAFVPLTLVLAFHNTSMVLWLVLLVLNTAAAAVFVLALVPRYTSHFSPTIRKLLPLWLVFSVVVGIPVPILWMVPTWPRYIPLSGMSACIFLFTTILGFNTLSNSQAIAPFLLFTVYLTTTPALLIWYGDISAVEGWSRELKVVVTCVTVAGTVALLLLYVNYCMFYAYVHLRRIGSLWRKIWRI